ncbi:hypothetical protein MAE02_44210 [Microvirga aerophila]|uniref:Uncharacterized protein n=1 Tax=Microvirga aerophila TaxID=670291 RepID=A0A512BXP3_9HYPH|nr:hypothetical protein MAE02_44210 [Microvirga aerophila]
MDKETFEAWYDGADHSIALTSLSEVTRLRAIGGWLKEPVFLHRIQSESLETAVEIHEAMMDWDNFHAHVDVVESCPTCKVRYFPRRTTSCPNCGSNPEVVPA